GEFFRAAVSLPSVMNTGTPQKVLAPSPLLAQITACGPQHRSGIVPIVVLKETRQTGLRGHSGRHFAERLRAQVPVTPERSALLPWCGLQGTAEQTPEGSGRPWTRYGS
ncbi:MAG: hypothetical protein ACR2N9_12780, partial [Acidimicrobiia bacterium]